MSNDETVASQFAEHISPELSKLFGLLGYGRVYEKAENVWVWDSKGCKYIDLLAGYGSANIGHNNPAMNTRIKSFLDGNHLNLSHVGPPVHAATLASKLSKLLHHPLSISLFSNSGSEAVEAALKLSIAATGRKAFLYCAGSYHGTSLATLSVMDEPRMRKPFRKILPKSSRILFGSLLELEKALKTKKYACFVVEPIQCEGGVNLPPPCYLKKAQHLCKKFGTLMVLDEVQTGIGRTGELFAYFSEDFVPDILVSAKALGGGIAPIGVTLTSPAIYSRAYGSMDRIAIHSYTFGGNAFSCFAAMATLDILFEEYLIRNAEERGHQFLIGLREKLAGHPLVRDIRGRGLIVGIELGYPEKGFWGMIASWVMSPAVKMLYGQWLSVRLLERGIILQPSCHKWNVLKIVPSLTISAQEAELAVDVIAGVFREHRSGFRIIFDSSLRMLSQFINGWKIKL